MRFESAVAGYETPGPNIRGLSVAMEAGCRVQLVVARRRETGWRIRDGRLESLRSG
jgi:hypothetical protein